MKEHTVSYFEKAKSWSNDIYTEAIVSRNRYRAVFIWSLFLMTGLLILIFMLLPLEHTEMIVVHRMDNGTVWVETPHTKYVPKHAAEVKSEIVRYVINRESYSADAYSEQYSLVNLLSSRDVAKHYIQSQNLDNKKAYINRFGHRRIRTVHVENVIFLDRLSLNRPKHKSSHHNLAQVDFTVTDRNKLTGKTRKHAFLALISWRYRGTPKDPVSKWRDWDGFTVTRYSIDQRNI
jgi:type IV secretion system protein VirB8